MDGCTYSQEVVMTDSKREDTLTKGQAGRLAPEIIKEIIYTIRENRQTFEEAMIKIVRALLNKQAERPALKQEHKEISDLTLESFRRKKSQAESVSKSLNSITDSAPSAPAAAAKVAIKTGNYIAESYYDNEQIKHIEEEARKNLTSAQYERYTTAQKHYTLIARKTARNISSELQFLLLGISSSAMKELLTLFKESMDKYGVKRLQENFSEKTPDEVSDALTDAAIPPPTDNVLYRQWLRINFSKWEVNLKFLSRIRLNKEQSTQAILEKGGPETQMIFGTSKSRINYKTLNEEELHDYTELGALNHAYVLCQEEFRLAGLNERAHELDGFTFKYPLILKRQDRTLGNLGINVLPRPTRMSLPEPLQQTILDIVPDFDQPATVSQQEIDEGRVILPDFTKRYLPHRKNYVPWSEARQTDLNARYKVIFTAGKASASQTNPHEITSVPGHARLLAMEEAGNIWDLEYARRDVEYAAQKAQEALNNIYDAESNDLTNTKQRLDATRAAKYLAISTSNFIHFLLKCRSYSPEDLNLAAMHIESARTTLNAARIAPIQEANDHHNLKQGIAKIKAHAAQCEQVQFSYMQSIEALLDEFIPFGSTFFTEEQQALAQKRKRLLKGINEDVAELKKLTKMAKAITQSRNREDELSQQTEAESLDEFDAVATTLHNQIFILENARGAKISSIVKNIELYTLETRILHNLILRTERKDIPEDISQALNRANECLYTAKTIAANRSRPQKMFPSSTRQRLLALKAAVTEQRNTCLARLTQLETETISNAELNEQDKIFFRRAQAYNKLTRILYLISQKPDDEDLQEQAQDLKEKVTAIYLALRDGRASLASTEFDELIADSQHTANITTLEGIIRQANQVSEGREHISLAISGDVEMASLSLKQAKRAMDKLSSVEREMLRADERLAALLVELETEQLIEDSNHSNMPSLRQLQTLQAALVSDRPEQHIGKLNTYTKKIYDVLVAIITDEAKQQVPTSELESQIEQGSFEHPQSSNVSSSIRSGILASIANLMLNSEPNIKLQTGEHADMQMGDITTSPLSESETSSAHSISSAVANWPVWLVFNAVKLKLNCLLNSPNGIKTIAKTARNELAAIQEISSTEPDRLTENKRIALREIKHTYEIILIAKEQQAVIAPTRCNQEVANDVVVQGVLDWASHLTYDEQVWRDDAHDRKQEITRRNQQEFIADADIIKTESFAYISVAITNLKQQKNLRMSLNHRISGKITEIQLLYPPSTEQKRNPELNKLSDDLKHLSAIINLQLEELNTKIDRLTGYIKTFTQQNLHAYFRVWQLEVRPKDQLENEQPIITESKAKEVAEIKPAKPTVTGKKSKSSAKSEHSIILATASQKRSEEKIKQDAAIYDYANIKKQYDKLHKQLTTILNRIHVNRLPEDSDEEDILSTEPPSKTPKKIFNASLRVSNISVFTEHSSKSMPNSSNGSNIVELSSRALK